MDLWKKLKIFFLLSRVLMKSAIGAFVVFGGSNQYRRAGKLAKVGY